MALANHQAARGTVIRVILVTDGLVRSRVTTTFHLQISGGVLLVMVTVVWSDAATLAG